MDEEIKKLLEQNLAYSKEIYTITKKIKGYITFQKFVSLFYIFIIGVPIILSIIYLPPLLKPLFSQYKALLGSQSPVVNPIENLLKVGADNLDNVNKVPDNIKGLIK